jgi:hypothetical protein
MDEAPLSRSRHRCRPRKMRRSGCLGDTSLQSPHATMCATRGRRTRFHGSHTCWPPIEEIRHTLSPLHTTRKSARLSGRARCLLSGQLQPGVCFFRDPLPAAPSRASQRAYLIDSDQEDNGFTEFHDDDRVGRVLPLYRRYYVSVSRTTEMGHPTACHFGSGAFSYFRLLQITIVTAVHLSSPDHPA